MIQKDSGLYPSSDTLRRAVALNQHHDAVTGTEKQHVAYDYAKRLSMGREECQVGQIFLLRQFYIMLFFWERFSLSKLTLYLLYVYANETNIRMQLLQRINRTIYKKNHIDLIVGSSRVCKDGQSRFCF